MMASPGPLTLDVEQQEILHREACRLIAAAAHGAPVPLDRAKLGALADQSVVGVFVTLRKSGTLRGCIGNFTPSIALGDALERAATGAASHDPRFPPVRPDELAWLSVDISLLHSRELLPESANERWAAIHIGLHGLDIQHQGRSGLLLPSVAVDLGWDALTFLREVCRKASLPADAWKDPSAALFRFTSAKWGGPFAWHDDQ